MNISYTTPKKERELVTGGQIYDNNLTSVIDKKTSLNFNNLFLNIGRWSSNLLIAPFLYLFKIAKTKDTDIYLFNSVIFMRFMLLPFYIKKIKRKKAIAIHHHFLHKELNGVKGKIYKIFEWKFLDQMDKIVVPSPYIYDLLLKRYNKEKLIFLKIPFDKSASRESKPIKGNLSFAGTIEQRKGLKYLLESLNILKQRGKNYPLKIMGKIVNEHYYEELKEFINKHGLDVTFTGFLSKEEKDNIMAETDVFVFPSLLEGYGMVLVEAQVYGLPIVSFDNSAMPYNVKNDKNGYAISTGDINAFADAIEKIVEDRELRNRLSAGALENLKLQNTFESFENSIVMEFNNLK